MTKVRNDPYPEGMAERLARVETTVSALSKTMDGLDRKFDAFVKTATSPDIGFISGAYLVAIKNELNERITGINTDHNERLQRLEGPDGRITKVESLQNRVLMWLVFLFGATLLDVVLHVTGVKP